ncbi:uncharacterized protein J4E78_010652 [Alternaria triticimaculans]|uniref:uncharacterized protein n=1 Tax=Alternaria triticimaculans TaxID=297637 RepID=UPI0020C2A37F|nr:uncharacterized protein J4E78_010652 [Alternaria triticimaculans]KAI4640528.1 hypothetical protein J4E78_010652 [Alternaria triticimaculans]
MPAYPRLSLGPPADTVSIPEVTAHPIDSQAPSFLNLSGEARNIVYELLFEFEQPIALSVPPSAHASQNYVPPVALLSTCRQIYHEAVGILYTRNRFLAATASGSTWLSALNHTTSWLLGLGSQARHLRHLTVHVVHRGRDLNELQSFHPVTTSNARLFEVLPLLRALWELRLDRCHIKYALAHQHYANDLDVDRSDALCAADAAFAAIAYGPVALTTPRKLLASVQISSSGTCLLRFKSSTEGLVSSIECLTPTGACAMSIECLPAEPRSLPDLVRHPAKKSQARLAGLPFSVQGRIVSAYMAAAKEPSSAIEVDLGMRRIRGLEHLHVLLALNRSFRLKALSSITMLAEPVTVRLPMNTTSKDKSGFWDLLRYVREDAGGPDRFDCLHWALLRNRHLSISVTFQLTPTTTLRNVEMDVHGLLQIEMRREWSWPVDFPRPDIPIRVQLVHAPGKHSGLQTLHTRQFLLGQLNERMLLLLRDAIQTSTIHYRHGIKVSTDGHGSTPPVNLAMSEYCKKFGVTAPDWLLTRGDLIFWMDGFGEPLRADFATSAGDVEFSVPYSHPGLANKALRSQVDRHLDEECSHFARDYQEGVHAGLYKLYHAQAEWSAVPLEKIRRSQIEQLCLKLLFTTKILCISASPPAMSRIWIDI